MMRKAALLCSIPCVMFASSLAVAADDKDFLSMAITGDNSEIALARLAIMKGNQDVKEFGQTLTADHKKAREEASALASKIGLTPPEGISNEAASENYKLDGLSGEAFDKEFVSYMTADHKKDIQKFKKEASSGSGETADLARKTLPVLEKHLSIAEKLGHKS